MGKDRNENLKSREEVRADKNKNKHIKSKAQISKS